MSGWEAFFADPWLWLAVLALLLAACVPISVWAIRGYLRVSDRRREVDWGLATDELPPQVYRPEDAEVIVGVDLAGSMETVVIAERQSDGRLHIVMAHTRTVDDE